MYYMATINAYDALDRVVLAAVVRATGDGTGDPVCTLLEHVHSVPGVGEDDPTEWLRDALIGLLESL